MSTTGSKPILAKDCEGREVRYQTDGDPLGSGSGGVVYLARRLPAEDEAAADDARRVAIKVASTRKWKGFLAEEARLLHSLQERMTEVAALSGARIYRPVRILSGPRPLEVDDNYESALIELEYLDGQTLGSWFENDWQRRADLDPPTIVDEVLRVGRQLAESLVQIQAGQDGALIHRDIKLDNIMRTSRGLRLFDFNIARADTDSLKTEHVGTRGYIAPEVMGGKVYDGRADLYSTGVVLWEIAHQKRFDFHTNTLRISDKIHLRWPTSVVEQWPDAERNALERILPVLITDTEYRLSSANQLIELLDEIRAARDAAKGKEDALAKLDMVNLLSELRPSGIASVVTDTSGEVPEQAIQDFLRARMQVGDPLEDWLAHEVTAAASADRSEPVLFVLAGNAGDGKSHLLYRLLRHRLADRPDLLKRIRWIADATHALHPTASQRDRLVTFFGPFADDDAATDPRVHVIAMNTGMVIRFFEGEAEKDRFASLYAELQRQLGLRRAAVSDARPQWRVEVVNLDLRDLLAPAADGGSSFAERMLDRLSTESEEGIPATKWSACQECAAFALCPVAFNLRALQSPIPRNALLTMLRRVALESDVHLSPRNMWGFLYRLVTGGVERYDFEGRDGSDGPCDVIRAQVASGEGAWLLAGQFTEVLFQQPGAGTPWGGLANHDPAYSSAPAIDHLHTRLSIKTELDNDRQVVEEELGGQGQALAGLALDALTAILPRGVDFKGRRRDAAVRRQVFFHQPTFECWLSHDGSREFSALLEAYRAYSTNPESAASLSADHREQLTELRHLVQDVFLHGNGRVVRGNAYLRVSQPNARATSELLVRADRGSLDPIFQVQKIVAPDVHIVAHDGRRQLLSLLGYRPAQVTLNVLGVRVSIDLALYDFLRRVNEGQKPSVRDLSQFQALLFIGERVGNELARRRGTKELFLWDGAANTLYRLGTDDFGQAHLNKAAGNA